MLTPGTLRLPIALAPGLLVAVIAVGCGAPSPDAPVVVVRGAALASSSSGSSSGPSAGGPSSSSGTSSGGGTVGASVSADGGTGAADGVPCDVAMVLGALCTTCHSDPPAPGALAGLVSYADLMAPSHESPAMSEAQLSVSRMQSSSSPMPPGGLPPSADVTTLQNWAAAGYPKGSCGMAASTSTAGSSTGRSSTSPPATADGGASAATGVPCDVATMLAANCTGCHSDPPVPSALAGLVTYADLMATAHEDATKNEAQLSLARMQNSSSPMPPSGILPATDVTTLQNWVNAGFPKGSCASGTGDGGAAPPPPPSVFANAPAFAPKTGPNTHNAGQNCMRCHAGGGGDAPQFEFGGTLYDASGNPVSGAEVRFVDANGNATSVNTGPAGTFYKSGAGFAGPAHVGVRNATSTQNMFTALQSGSQPPASTGGACSACHCTGTGCTVAPIHLP